MAGTIARKPRRVLETPRSQMSSDRRLCLSLLALGLLAHAGALAAPWVRAWTPDMAQVGYSGAQVLGHALEGGHPWGVLALAHLLSALTLVAAWRIPRRTWIRRSTLAALVGPSLLLALALAGAGLWNGADAWPEGWPQQVIHALAPDGWWVQSGLLAWGIAQAFFVGVLLVRAGAGSQLELAGRWARRPGATTSTAEPSLSAVAASLRPLVLEAHRLRVDLDAPVRPLDDGSRAQLMDLALRLQQLAPGDREALRRVGVDAGALGAMLLSSRARKVGGWLAELYEIDRSLHELVEAASRPVQLGYR